MPKLRVDKNAEAALCYDELAKGREYVEHLEGVWQRLGDLPLQRFCAMIDQIESDAAPAPKRIADLGCGTGRDMPLIRNMLESPSHVIGCDVSQGMLRHARARGGEVVRSSIADFLAGAKEPFDAVWCHYALIHLGTMKLLRAQLRQIRESLSPNGVYCLGLKCGNGKRIIDPADATAPHPRPTTYFRQGKVEQLLEEVGLRAIWVLCKPAKREPVEHRYTWFLGSRI